MISHSFESLTIEQITIKREQPVCRLQFNETFFVILKLYDKREEEQKQNRSWNDSIDLFEAKATDGRSNGRFVLLT